MGVGGLAPALSPDEEEERLRLEAQGLAPPSFDDTMAAGAGGAVPAPPPAPASPAPAAAPLVVAQPGDVSKTVVSQKRAGPQSAAALNEGDAAGVATVDATRREQDAIKAEKQAEAQGTSKVANLEHQQAVQRADFERREAERLKNIDIMAEQDMVKAKEGVELAYQQQQRGYFADKPWFTGVLAAVAVAASRRNMRIMGENPNASGVQASIDKAIDQDLKAKEARYLKSKEYLEEVKARPGEARKLLERKRGEFVAMQAAELNIIAKEAAKMKASQALDPARVDAEADRIVATAQEKYAEGRLKRRQDYDATVARTDVDPAAGAPGTVTPAAMQKYNALKYQAAVADRGLAKIQELTKAGVPKPGSPKWDEYQSTLNATAAAMALVESGNPESEASDPTKRAIKERIGRGAVESVGIDLAAGAGLTEGTASREATKLANERANIANRLKTFEQSFGGVPTPQTPATPEDAKAAAEAGAAAKAHRPAPKDAKAITKEYTAAIAEARRRGLPESRIKELQREMAQEIAATRKR